MESMKLMKLVGKISVSNVEPELESTVIATARRYNITKAEAARTMLREGAKVVGNRKKLIIQPVS